MDGPKNRERIQPRLTSGDSAVLERAWILLAGSFLGGILVLINEALIAQFLGIQHYGFYALAAMFARIGSILSAFGLPLAVLHFVPINLSQRDHPRAMGTIVGSLFMPGLFGTAFGICVWLSSDWFANSVFQDPGAAPYIRGLAIAVPFLALLEVIGFLGRGFGSAFSYVFTRNLGPPICYFLVLLYLRHAAAPPTAITWGMPVANITASIIGAVYMLFLTRKILGWVKPILELKTLFTYSMLVSFNLIASLVIVSTDLFLIGVFSTAKVAGLYRACVQLVIPFDLILTASSSATAPAYSVFVHDRLHDRLRDSYLGANHLVTLLAVPLFLLLLFNGQDILGILGPEFPVAATGLSILAFGQLARVYSGNAAVILTMGRKQNLEAINSTIAALFNVAANLILIPRFGLIGAAVGTSLSLLLLAGLRIVQIWRVFRLTTFNLTELRFVAITALTAGLSYWASGSVGLGAGTGIGHLIIRFALMGTLIAFSIWYFCLNKEERDLLLAITRFKRNTDSSDSFPAQQQKMLPENDPETIPNFFVVGAPRCGTTSFWKYLSSHPQVYMSYQKEPLFFGSDLTKVPGEFLVLEKDAYFELFRRGKGKAVRGEASVMYMFSKNAAREIYQCNPKARILICLRNPVDLVYSYYGQLRWGGYEDIRSFDGALEAETDRRMGRRVPKSALVPEALYYSEIGMLGAQVERYLKVFPREQLHFVMFDDLMKDTAKSYLGLLDFLGIARVEPRSYVVRNPHKEARSLTLSAWFQRPPWLAQLMLALVPQPYRYIMLGHLQRLLNTRLIRREEMRPETRRRLQDYFASDIERLGVLIGRDLSGWLRPRDDRHAPVTHPSLLVHSGSSSQQGS
jgi:O-antigen/teichoic acid export membrane protein